MKASAPAINFHFQQRCTLANRNLLRQMIISVFKRYRTKFASLNIIFCSDEFLLDINRTYLNHDYYTDIITFTLSAPSAPVEGEIYISIDRVKDNAKAEGVSFTHELHRIIFHGVLHLCGFNDKKPTDKAEMTRYENKLLNLYFRST